MIDNRLCVSVCGWPGLGCRQKHHLYGTNQVSAFITFPPPFFLIFFSFSFSPTESLNMMPATRLGTMHRSDICIIVQDGGGVDMVHPSLWHQNGVQQV